MTQIESEQWNCQAGQYWDENQQVCRQCAIGYYQTEVGQTQCEPCTLPKTTVTEGAVSESHCILNCSAGKYYNEDTTTCTDCPQGYFNPDAGQTECLPCPFLTHTPGTGSTSDTQCTEETRGCRFAERCGITAPSRRLDSDDFCFCSTSCIRFEDCCQDFFDICASCELGYQFNTNVENCTECPLNMYRDNSTRECQACLNGYRTLNTGSTTATDCQPWCSAGQYLIFEEDSVVCELCPLDTFKVQSDYFAESCIPCPAQTPRNYVTGATTSNSCIYAACTSGQEFNTVDASSCEDCPLDTFQDSEYPVFNLDVCQPCPEGTGTREEAATSDLCITVCDDGHEYIKSSNSCEPCPVGTYKDNSVNTTARFDSCFQCPTGFTTSISGATQQTACSTEIASCGTGQEYNPLSDQCEACQVGHYKHEAGTSSCVACEQGFTTEGIGAQSSEDCSVELCPVGTYRDQTSGSCTLCPMDTYQNLENQDSCEDCPDGHATNTTGADDRADCTRFCPSGQEGDGISCSECRKGFYKDNDESVTSQFDPCQPCPVVKHTTDTLGATNVDQCSIECEAGSYSNTNSQCEFCPYGTYQPDVGRNQCLSCDSGKGTNQRGTVSANQCIALTLHRFLLDLSTTLDCESFSVTDSSDLDFQRYKTSSVQATEEEIILNIDDDLRQTYVLNFIGFRCNSPLHVILELMLSNLQDTAATVTGLETTLQAALSDSVLGETVTLAVVPTAQSEDLFSLKTDLECVAGYYSDLNTNECVACAQNTFQPPDVRELCWPCPQGTSTETTATVGTEATVCLGQAQSTTESTSAQDNSTSQVTVLKNVSYLAIGLGAGLSGLFLLVLLGTVLGMCIKKESMWSKLGSSYYSRSTVRSVPQPSRSSRYRGMAYNPYVF